jgi:hypothetical protein
MIPNQIRQLVLITAAAMAGAGLDLLQAMPFTGAVVTPSFNKDVMPILFKYCANCHSGREDDRRPSKLESCAHRSCVIQFWLWIAAGQRPHRQ